MIADPDFNLADDGTVPSVPAAVPGQAARARDLRWAALGPVRRLAGTRAEGEAIARLLDGALLWLDAGALDGRFKRECRSPCILHLATHGLFRPDDESDAPTAQASGRPVLDNALRRSVILLAGYNTAVLNGIPVPDAGDGLLTAEDVSGMDLLGTELVVLSACDTGRGRVHTGEGVFGLRRTFVLAGARTLVMSLWKVPDRATQELMVDFYRRLLAGEPRGEALRAAQLSVRASHPHPRSWAAFICQGDPGPLGGGPRRPQERRQTAR